MHMSDALLSPAVGGTMLALSAGTLAYAVREVKKNFQEERIPLMGVAGAFVFAAQMLNFAIPGTGSSGHITGAVLLSALLGSSPAFIVMAGVLLIQALFFADGGLLAWGGNLFNMAFFGCFLAYPLVFRPLAGTSMSRGRLLLASVAANVVSLQCGAFAVTLQTLLSGITELPFGAFVTAMLPIHLAIAIGEGLATGLTLCFIRQHLPNVETLKLEEEKPSLRRLSLSLGTAALVLGGGLSLLASASPDGLEWSMERTAGTAELEATGALHELMAKIAEACAVLPDYAFPNSESWFGTTVSGVVGVLLCIVVLALLGYALCSRQRHAQGSSAE